MMKDDLVLNKTIRIERCIQRINAEYLGHEKEFSIDVNKQDVIILNILRANEAAIDIANHIIRLKRFGIPQSSRDAFAILEENHIIDSKLSQKLQAMVGFRNIALRDYVHLNLEIIKSIIEKNLTDLLKFSKLLLTLKFN